MTTTLPSLSCLNRRLDAAKVDYARALAENDATGGAEQTSVALNDVRLRMNDIENAIRWNRYRKGTS